MNYFKFDCPYCNQSLEAPEDIMGTMIECPSCNGQIQLPNSTSHLNTKDTFANPQKSNKKIILRKPQKQAISKTDAKERQCPFCGEEILKIAIKCKHCGSDLIEKKECTLKQKGALGLIALLLPICAVFLAWFWVGNMTLFEDPASKLFGILAFIIVATSILIAVEANFVDAGVDTDTTPSGNKRAGPVAWFFLSILLWIIFFPLWMHRRSSYGLRNYSAAAILIGIVFAFTFSFMLVSIENKKAEITHEFENFGRRLEDAQRELDRSFEEFERQFRKLR